MFEGKKHSAWIKEYTKEIFKCIGERKIDIIIISAPSFALFEMAGKIKREFPNVKIVFDYRDPWYLWNGRKNIALIKEKMYLLHADKIVCFSEPFRQEMCKTFHLGKEKTEVIYNCYSAKGIEQGYRRSVPSTQDRRWYCFYRMI